MVERETWRTVTELGLAVIGLVGLRYLSTCQIPQRIRDSMLDEANGLCGCCGKDIHGRETIHHIMPQAFKRAGLDREIYHHPLNLVVYCRDCHVHEDKVSLGDPMTQYWELARKLRAEGCGDYYEEMIAVASMAVGVAEQIQLPSRV